MKVTDSEKITASEVIAILEKHGIIITEAQAEKILAFMDSFAKIIIKQYLN